MRYLAEMLILRVAAVFFRVIPSRAGLYLGRGLGRLAYCVASRRRKLAIENISRAFGAEISGERVKEIARLSFESLGMTAMEFFRLPLLARGNIEDLTSIEGEKNLRDSLEAGQGVLVLSAHLGNWDMLSAGLALRGYPLALITKVARSRALNRIWMDYRRKVGIGLYMGRGTLKESIGQLRRGGIVGFVLDQNARRTEGVFVPFFGREACTITSLALLARRTGVPVLPLYTYRDGGIHRIVIEKPLVHDSMEDTEADILERTRLYTRWTERTIRKHPEQWTWLHDRWKTRPRP